MNLEEIRELNKKVLAWAWNYLLELIPLLIFVFIANYSLNYVFETRGETSLFISGIIIVCLVIMIQGKQIKEASKINIIINKDKPKKKVEGIWA